MLNAKKHAPELAKLRQSERPCPYPVFYSLDGQIRLGGLFDDKRPGNPFGPKSFELPGRDGALTSIPDLLSVDLLFLNGDGYFDTYSQRFILEPPELADVYLFAVRAKDEFRCDPDYYSRFESIPSPSRVLADGYKVVDAELFELAIFHNAELVHVIGDVFRGFKVGRNVQVIYVKPNPSYQGDYLDLPNEPEHMSEQARSGEPPYAYWLYAEGESSAIGFGWNKDPRFIATERQSALYGLGPQPPSTTAMLSASGGHVTLRYHYEPSAMFQMLDRYANEYGSVSPCVNLFDDDTSRNYSVDFPVSDQDHIAFIDYILNCRPSLAGEALYWSDLDDYYCGTDCLDTGLRLLNASPKTREAHRELLRRLYQKCDQPYDETSIPRTISRGVISGTRHIQELRRYVESTHPLISLWNPREGRDLDSDTRARIDSYFSQRGSQFERMKAAAEANFGGERWTSERTLFEMVQSYYPDAVYQYRAGWLGQQSLDVFIPSVGTALEYQGRQHYKSAAYFGGEAALDKNKERDSVKRRACESEGIRLVAWPYWVPISALTLLELLHESGSRVLLQNGCSSPLRRGAMGALGRKSKGEDHSLAQQTIESAISHGECIEFRYTSTSGEKSQRVIRPYDLSHRGPSVRGFCFLRSAERVFALSRMHDVSIVDEAEIASTSVELSSHQDEIRQILSRNGRLLVLAETGTGTTLPVLLHLSDLLQSRKIDDALVVAPLSALGAWERDIAKLSPDRQYLIRENILLVNYDKLSRRNGMWQKRCWRSWGCIVLDEGHAIANPSSNCTQYFVGRGKALGLASKAKYRYLLTDTLISNSRLEDLWGPLRFILDDAWLPWVEFKRQYLTTRNGLTADSSRSPAATELLAIVGQHSCQVPKEE